MTRVTQPWTAFNAGELSPLMAGRVDQEKYASGCATLLNMLPLVQGPAMRRAGTRYVGQTKDNGAASFIDFEFSAEQSYVLEFGNEYLRFWVSRGQLLNGGSPYELATPYTSADLVSSDGTRALRTAQSGDVLWICTSNGSKPPQKLERMGATTWTIANAPFDLGPFEDIDPTSTTNISVSSTTNDAYLWASATGVFRTQDIGTCFYMEVNDPAAYGVWTPAATFSVGDIVRYEGNFYRCVGAGTAGASPPVHLRGTATDGGGTGGAAPCSWLYLHSGYGIIKIGSVAGDGASATGVVMPTSPGGDAYFPDQIVSSGSVGTVTTGPSADTTPRWARSLFNDYSGWPVDVKFFRGRLCYVGGARIVCSYAGDYDDFRLEDGPAATASTGMNLPLAINKIDSIRWIAESYVLLGGASRQEFSIQEQTTTQAFSASNVKASPETSFGARLVEPITVSNAILFVERAGKKIREMTFSIYSEHYQSEDLTVMAEHILRPGVVDMTFAAEPDTLLVCAMADGTLAVLTYNRERGVVAWSRFQLGGSTDSTAYGFVETVSSIASPDTTRDDVWLIVRRNVNGSQVRYVEYLEDPRLVLADPKSAFYVDAGLSYSGSATKAITGLTHLIGQTVQVLADGTEHADCVVDDSGAIALNRAASVVQVGLGFTSIVSPMRPDAGGADGSAQTHRKSFGDMWLRLDNSMGGKVGPSLDRLDPIPYMAADYIIGTVNMPFTGDKKVNWPADLGTDGYVYIVQDRPLPFTLCALFPRLDTGDD